MTTNRLPAVAIAVIALVVSACSSGTDQAGQAPATSSVAAGIIHSTLIDIALPPGTKISSHADGVEIWQTPGTLQQTVDAMTPQLPIGRDLDGLRWCAGASKATDTLVVWKWGGPGGSIVVVASSGGELRIERSASPATGCP